MRRLERVARAIHKEMAGGDPDKMVHHWAQKSWETPEWRAWQQFEHVARIAIAAYRAPPRVPRS